MADPRKAVEMLRSFCLPGADSESAAMLFAYIAMAEADLPAANFALRSWIATKPFPWKTLAYVDYLLPIPSGLYQHHQLCKFAWVACVDFVKSIPDGEDAAVYINLALKYEQRAAAEHRMVSIKSLCVMTTEVAKRTFCKPLQVVGHIDLLKGLLEQSEKFGSIFSCP